MPGQKPCFLVALDDVHIRKYVGNIVTPGEYPKCDRVLILAKNVVLRNRAAIVREITCLPKVLYVKNTF